jgi:DNA-binding response OmpR family regulator
VDKLERPIEILFIGDHPGEAPLTLDALAGSKLSNIVRVIRDAPAALALLRQQDEYAAALSPDLILLDLTLPDKSGLDILSEIRASQDLRSVPVLVLTSSSADVDLVHRSELRVEGYLTKPLDSRQLVDRLQAIEDFGLVIVTMSSAAVLV